MYLCRKREKVENLLDAYQKKPAMKENGKNSWITLWNPQIHLEKLFIYFFYQSCLWRDQSALFVEIGRNCNLFSLAVMKDM